MTLPHWAAGLPDWVRDDEVRWLSKRPWISAFIREQDYSLDPAIERFDRSQRRLRTLLGGTRGAGQLVAVRGTETTAYRYATGTGVIRSVRVQSPDAERITGIAVPYNEHSHPVQADGVVFLEQFDRQSFDHLPPSCPLIDSHDYSRPRLGRVTALRHTSDGLAIEATITRDNQTWRQRWIRGEHSSLSIAFGGAAIFDQWTEQGGLPLRTVRGARLVDVAVVASPAYPTARITDVLGAA